MYLADTDVISESRKASGADAGVRRFFREAVSLDHPVYVSAISIGELRRGVEMIRYRGDRIQAAKLERWLNRVVQDYAESILAFDADSAQVWGRLRVPHHENALDKQIAAAALIHDLTVVTRNVAHFESTGVRLLNPFEG